MAFPEEGTAIGVIAVIEQVDLRAIGEGVVGGHNGSRIGQRSAETSSELDLLNTQRESR